LIIELADGSRMETNRELIDQRIVIPGFNGAQNLVITKLNKYDVILGMPWFRKYRPVIDWEKGTIEMIGKNDEEKKSDQSKISSAHIYYLPLSSPLH